MPDTALIRAAVVDDAAALLSLQMDAIAAIGELHYTAAQRQAWSGERTPQHYLAPITSKVMRVAQADAGSPLMGFGQLDLTTGLVEAIYVRPAVQRSGIGRQLLQALESSASGTGAQVLWLDASLNAVAFYVRQGFEVLSEHEHPVGAQVTIPCVRMRKRL